MKFWDTVEGHDTAEAIFNLSREFCKRQQYDSICNDDVQKTVKDMIDDGYTVVHIIPGEEKTVIVYK